jgi:hypothetical protein
MDQHVPSSSAAQTQVGIENLSRNEAHSSGVSWAAVIAGAFVGAALSLALLALGAGIGLSAVSPWASAGASGSRIGRTAIGWLVFTQLIASVVGGYLAGRLRTRWVHVHTHEVYFRDTAHGFLVWAVGLVITTAFLTSAATSISGGSTRARMAIGDMPESTQSNDGLRPNAYVIDKLLRTTASRPDQDDAPVRNQIAVIFAIDLRDGGLPPADRSYVAQLVAAKTGSSESDAERRVDQAFAEAQQATDNARKALAHTMYWTFVALLIGAFSASVAATIGGKERDSVVVV